MLFLDQRRLEVCRDGIGQAILVDIHISGDYGLCGYYPAGSHFVRQSAANQCPVIGNTVAHTNSETKLQ